MIENAWLNLSDFEIDGRRLNGQDVFFYRTFDDQNSSIGLTNSFSNQPINLDIPQGIYSLLNFDLHFKENPHPLEMRTTDDDDEE